MALVGKFLRGRPQHRGQHQGSSLVQVPLKLEPVLGLQKALVSQRLSPLGLLLRLLLLLLLPLLVRQCQQLGWCARQLAGEAKVGPTEAVPSFSSTTYRGHSLGTDRHRTHATCFQRCPSRRVSPAAEATCGQTPHRWIQLQNPLEEVVLWGPRKQGVPECIPTHSRTTTKPT